MKEIPAPEPYRYAEKPRLRCICAAAKLTLARATKAAMYRQIININSLFRVFINVIYKIACSARSPSSKRPILRTARYSCLRVRIGAACRGERLMPRIIWLTAVMAWEARHSPPISRHTAAAPGLPLPLPARAFRIQIAAGANADGVHGRARRRSRQWQNGRAHAWQELLQCHLEQTIVTQPGRFPGHRSRPDWLLRFDQAGALPIQLPATGQQHARAAAVLASIASRWSATRPVACWRRAMH